MVTSNRCVHRDVFIVTGDSMQLWWIESRLKEGLIIKRRAILGPEDGDDKTVTILNRLLTWVSLYGSRNQVEIEADPRHRKILLAQMNLDGSNVKSVTTPAVKVPEWTPQTLTQLDKDRTSMFRSATMRASYMSVKRVDVQQRHVKAPRVDIDSDYAGCVLTRKSTTCAHLFSWRRHAQSQKLDAVSATFECC